MTQNDPRSAQAGEPLADESLRARVAAELAGWEADELPDSLLREQPKYSLLASASDKRTGVLRVDDRDHELHPGGTIPSRSGYAGAPSRASPCSASRATSSRWS